MQYSQSLARLNFHSRVLSYGPCTFLYSTDTSFTFNIFRNFNYLRSSTLGLTFAFPLTCSLSCFQTAWHSSRAIGRRSSGLPFFHSVQISTSYKPHQCPGQVMEVEAT